MKSDRSKHVWSVARRLGTFAGAAVVGLGVLCVAFDHRFHPRPSRPSFAPPADQADADRQDIDALAQILSLDESFDDAKRAAFERQRAALRARTGRLTRAQFELGIASLVALSENGHTTVSTTQRAGRFARVPLRFAWFAEGLFIVRATARHRDLLGAQVEEIDDRPPEDVRAAARPFLSGTPELSWPYATLLFEEPTLLHAIWADAPEGRLALRLRMPSGEVAWRDIVPVEANPETPPIEPVRVIAPRAIAGEGPEWKTAIADDGDLPVSLLEPDRSVYDADMSGGVYVRVNAIQDDDRGPLNDQLAQILARSPAGGWRWFALDLRFDGGGDYTKTLAFTRELGEHIRPDGTLYLMTGNSTFSAAIVTLARAKALTPARSIIVGEMVGDHQPFWAERGEALVLPNSGIRVSYATGKHDWSRGCMNPLSCFWLNLPYGVAAGDLAPERPVAWRYADYVIRRDTVLDAVRDAVDHGGERGAFVR